MKRDMDLIRQLLLAIESQEEPNRYKKEFPSDYEKRTVDYHIALLIEAELVLGNVVTSNDEIVSTFVARLTWEGHEFLDAARDESGWKQVMRKTASTVGTTSISVLQAMLVKYATEILLT